MIGFEYFAVFKEPQTANFLKALATGKKPRGYGIDITGHRSAQLRCKERDLDGCSLNALEVLSTGYRLNRQFDHIKFSAENSKGQLPRYLNYSTNKSGLGRAKSSGDQ